MNGGPDRTDYAYVASYRCPGGEVPLGGRESAGARALLGNVGPGPDGHFLDLYEIPCPSAPVRLYVDAYHCGDDVDVEVDLDDLSPVEARRFAEVLRRLEHRPFDPLAARERPVMVEWAVQSDQVDVPLCPALLGELVGSGYPHEAMLQQQLVISTAAAALELSGQNRHPALATALGLRGAIRLYQAIVRQAGTAASHPWMDELASMSDERIADLVLQALDRCEGHRSVAEEGPSRGASTVASPPTATPVDDEDVEVAISPSRLDYQLLIDGEPQQLPDTPECVEFRSCCQANRYVGDPLPITKACAYAQYLDYRVRVERIVDQLPQCAVANMTIRRQLDADGIHAPGGCRPLHSDD